MPTVEDVLAMMAITQGRGWRILSNGSIRALDGCCPLVALAREVEGTNRICATHDGVAARALGIGEEARVRIVCAADHFGINGTPRTRHALLKALGIQL